MRGPDPLVPFLPLTVEYLEWLVGIGIPHTVPAVGALMTITEQRPDCLSPDAGQTFTNSVVYRRRAITGSQMSASSGCY